jgi:hypothetical protein
MFRERATRLFDVHRILVLTLSLSAAAGWVSFAVSSQSSAEMQDQLRLKVTNLQDAQARLLSEQSKTRASLSEMGRMRADLAAARTEIARLSQAIAQPKPELPPLRPESRESVRTSPAIDAASKTGSIVTKASKPLLVKAILGDRPSPQDRDRQAAVKIATPDNQKKVAEESQRSAMPATRPELDTASLRQLTKSAEAQAQ